MALSPNLFRFVSQQSTCLAGVVPAIPILFILLSLQELNTKNKELQTLSHYLFDGKGKSFRPMVVLLCARACNIHAGSNSR